jgi:Kef-type K+ transport system membrane component KefB
MEWLSFLAENPFYEFAIILLLAAIIGALGQLLRQPLIIMFIVLGILVGPTILDIAKSKDYIHLLAEIGIAVLLFIVGLKLDIRLIKSIGKVAVVAGLGQVLFTSVIGYFIGIALGLEQIHSIYVAIALTFSSTIIIVKLLSDKKEIDSLHGQIAIGFLIIQDIVVILVIIGLSTFGTGEDVVFITQILTTIGMTLVLLVFTYIMMKWVIPAISYFLAKSQELMALFAIAWAVSLASFSQIIGFSGEVGAFLAGISLATSPFKDAINSRLVSLRDFLLLFFFVNLGTTIDFSIIGEQFSSALILSLFVLIGNPIIVLIILGLMGYKKRTSFLAGLTVAQISEFSLIFAGIGLSLGHLNEKIVGLITLVGLITIGLSTYLILYSKQIYNAISPALQFFEKKNPYRESIYEIKEFLHFELVIVGLGRFGSKIAEFLDTHPEIHYLGVDFDPKIIKSWKSKGKPIIYGDIDDPDIFEHIPFENTKCIVSTINDKYHSLQLLKTLRKKNFEGRIFLTAHEEEDIEMLQECNPDVILMPYKMASENFYNSFLRNLIENTGSNTPNNEKQ